MYSGWKWLRRRAVHTSVSWVVRGERTQEESLVYSAELEDMVQPVHTFYLVVKSESVWCRFGVEQEKEDAMEDGSR